MWNLSFLLFTAPLVRDKKVLHEFDICLSRNRIDVWTLNEKHLNNGETRANEVDTGMMKIKYTKSVCRRGIKRSGS